MGSCFGDRDSGMQQRGYPNIDTKLVGKLMEVLSKYVDQNRKVLDVWEKGEFIAIPVMK